MAFEDLLYNNRVGKPLEYIPTGTFDIASGLMGDIGMSIPASITKLTVEQTLKNERNSLIKERFGGLEEVTGIKRKSRDPIGIKAELESQLSKLDSLIEEGRSNGDDRFSDIKTRAEISEDMKMTADFAREESQSALIRSKSAFSTVAGTVLGMAAGSFTDLVNLPTLFMGASASTGILRAMGTEALINAGVEVAQTPWSKEWNEELGREFGAKDVLGNVAGAALGGALFTGVARGIGKGADVGLKKWEAYRRIGNNPDVLPEVREASKYQELVNHIDESAPVANPAKASDAEFVSNRKNYIETQNAFEKRALPVYDKADLFDMDTLSFKTSGELSDENIGRVFDRIGDEAIILEVGRFENRKSADEFIRNQLENNREFITQKTQDGNFVVMKIKDKAVIISNEDGSFVKYKSFEDAKIEATKLNKANPKERYNAISFNKEKGKSAQAHVIVKGKFNTQEIKSIKSNQEYFKSINKKRLEIDEGLTIDGRVQGYNDRLKAELKRLGIVKTDKDFDNYYSKSGNEFHENTDLIFNSSQKIDDVLAKSISDVQGSKVIDPVLESRFNEIVSKDPEGFVFNEKGHRVKNSDLLAELEEDKIIEKALTTCGVK